MSSSLFYSCPRGFCPDYCLNFCSCCCDITFHLTKMTLGFILAYGSKVWSIIGKSNWPSLDRVDHITSIVKKERDGCHPLAPFLRASSPGSQPWEGATNRADLPVSVNVVKLIPDMPRGGLSPGLVCTVKRTLNISYCNHLTCYMEKLGFLIPTTEESFPLRFLV